MKTEAIRLLAPPGAEVQAPVFVKSKAEEPTVIDTSLAYSDITLK